VAVPNDPSEWQHERYFFSSLLDREHEVFTINGKAWPYTERLTVRQGEPVHWRVLNPTSFTHPMHLHGAYFTVLGIGSSESYTQYTMQDRRTVVTELAAAGGTFDLLWTPLAPGGWLFHCHYLQHMSPTTAVPRVVRPTGSDHGGHTEAVSSASINRQERWDLGGLVLGITVEPRPGVRPVAEGMVKPRHLQLVLRKTAAGEAAPSTIRSSIREGAVEVAGAPGPPLVLTRGEAVEIEILNELGEPTSIHWHGIELESYFDGVPGVGTDSRGVTPTILPGRSFVARMRPPRAGTFIYHSHWRPESQIADGLYGPIVVVDPGRGFNPRIEKILVIGYGDNELGSRLVLLNGSRTPAPINLERGRTHRLRLINIAPNQDADVSLRRRGELLEWRPVAKDGWELPPHRRQMRASEQWISVGETYDFEFTASEAADYVLEVRSHFFRNRRVTAVVMVR
jgi:manganese oxidase